MTPRTIALVLGLAQLFLFCQFRRASLGAFLLGENELFFLPFLLLLGGILYLARSTVEGLRLGGDPLLAAPVQAALVWWAAGGSFLKSILWLAASYAAALLLAAGRERTAQPELALKKKAFFWSGGLALAGVFLALPGSISDLWLGAGGLDSGEMGSFLRHILGDHVDLAPVLVPWLFYLGLGAIVWKLLQGTRAGPAFMTGEEIANVAFQFLMAFLAYRFAYYVLTSGDGRHGAIEWTLVDLAFATVFVMPAWAASFGFRSQDELQGLLEELLEKPASETTLTP